jgi:hypothetical protein
MKAHTLGTDRTEQPYYGILENEIWPRTPNIPTPSAWLKGGGRVLGGGGTPIVVVLESPGAYVQTGKKSPSCCPGASPHDCGPAGGGPPRTA